MSGRHTGWMHSRGGRDRAQPGHVQAARALLGRLQNRLRLGGIASGIDRLILQDGTYIEASVTMGMPSVRIVPPVPVGGRRLRVKTTAYVGGYNGASSVVHVIDLAEYDVIEGVPVMTREIYEYQRSFNFGGFSNAFGFTPNLASDSPLFDKHFYLMDGEAGPNGNTFYKYRHSDGELVASFKPVSTDTQIINLIDVDDGRRRFLARTFGNGGVYVVDAGTMTLAGHIPLGEYLQSYHATADNSGRYIYVAYRKVDFSLAVAVYDIDTFAWLTEFNLSQLDPDFSANMSICGTADGSGFYCFAMKSADTGGNPCMVFEIEVIGQKGQVPTFVVAQAPHQVGIDFSVDMKISRLDKHLYLQINFSTFEDHVTMPARPLVGGTTSVMPAADFGNGSFSLDGKHLFVARESGDVTQFVVSNVTGGVRKSFNIPGAQATGLMGVVVTKME